ncbi:hypothetical protein ABZ801_17990 [Actinomadura sp. NPDC047616]|uniref:hypothetical protein n=1 Tax=Actinomadura sp. NPDC047616 TaxID=3155914 RepID=UPI0033F58246
MVASCKSAPPPKGRGARTLVATPDASDTITCREREDDGGRWWFFASDGTPIIEADDAHLDDAAILVLGHLARCAEHPKGVR